MRLHWLLVASLLAAAQSATAAPGDSIYMREGLSATARDGARLNFNCLGRGPTVVFDGGFSDWSPAWAIVQPRIAAFARACSYDRAGSGFSGPGPFPRTTERIATELHDALKAAGIIGPYILVGHAFGGDHVRGFADLFPSDVAGLVLVEADASDVDTPANRNDDDQGDLRYVPRLRECRDAIAAGNPLYALKSRSAGPPLVCATLFFRGLPEAQWSPELNSALLKLAQTKVAMWDAIISEMQEMPADEIWLQQHRRELGRTPVWILSSGNHGVGHLDDPPDMSLDQLKYAYDRALAQSKWLSLSTDSKQIFVNKSSEYIQFDAPDAVVDAVREIAMKSK